MQRTLGDIGDGHGPLLLVMAGMHGNETAGIRAVQRLVRHLAEHDVDVRGRFLALVGNLRAVHGDTRYQVKDLNRQWYETKIKKLKVLPLGFLNTPEDREQKKLIAKIERSLDALDDGAEALMLDLHTTSAEGGFFSIVNHDRRSIDHARAIGAPVIEGLIDVVEGTALEYIERLGHPALAFEAGQHGEPHSEQRMIAAMVRLLDRLDMVDRSALARFDPYVKALAHRADDLPDVVRFAHRHAVEPEHRFTMKPGYRNFDRVRRGEILGKDRSGFVTCPCDGYILMPLYQPQGEDGFFVVKGA